MIRAVWAFAFIMLFGSMAGIALTSCQHRTAFDCVHSILKAAC